MKRGIFLLIILQSVFCTYAQKPAASAVQYPSVYIIDARADTNDVLLGRFKTDLYTLQYRLKPDSLHQLMKRAYSACSDKSDKMLGAHQLVIILRSFYVIEERSGLTKLKAAFHYRADYFAAEKAGQFTYLGPVDSIIHVADFDIAQKVIHTFEQSLCGIYTDLMQQRLDSNHQLYSYEDVLHYDEHQKNKLPLYTDSLKDNAVYASWKDFLNLRKKPDYAVVLAEDEDYRIEYKNSRGKLNRAPIKYASFFSFNGKAYYNIEGVPCELYKKDGDFYTVGKIGASNAPVQIIMFGAAVAFIKNGGNFGDGTYEFKLDYRNGELIPIRQIHVKRK